MLCGGGWLVRLLLVWVSMLARVEKLQRTVWHDRPAEGAERAMLLAADEDTIAPLGMSTAAMKCAIVEQAHHGQLLAIYDDTCAFSAAVRQRGFPFLRIDPVANDLFPVTVPTLREFGAHETVRHLLASITQPILLEAIPSETELFKLLVSEAPHVHTLSRWERAALKTTGGFETWLSENFDHKRRKELKRLRNRFAEQGALVSQSLSPGEDFEPYLQDFLALEQRGWKGERGTSVSGNTGLVDALRIGLRASHEKVALRFWRITFNGAPVAALFAVVDKGHAMLGKIAYDETWSKYSPGVLIILDATADLFADPSVEMADSNAIPGHPMIERIWRDRLSFADIMIAPTGMSAARFAWSKNIEELRRGLRQKMKSVYYRVKGEQPS
jgi:hypothetical protein